MKLPPSLIFLFLLSLATGFLSACQRPAREDLNPVDRDRPLTIVQGDETESYSLEDPECEAREMATTPLGDVGLFQWQDGAVTESFVDTTSLEISGLPLRSPFVDSVTTGAVFLRKCDANASMPPDCRDREMRAPGWSESKRGVSLKICKSRFKPGRQSLEHMALSAVVTIEKTARSLRDILPPGRTITPITVLAAPRFESQWKPWSYQGQTGSYRALAADNLAYFPETSDTPPFIAVLPKSLARPDAPRLWESEFVMAHEYSHHIERVLRLDHYREQRSFIRLAVSEGFADILAFATQDASSRSLKGLPCVGFDRSPDHPEFSNGIAKIIDDSLINRSIDTSTIDEKKSICQGVTPHSPHGLGAIMAYWLAQFASYTPGYEKDPARTIATMSIDWLTRAETDMGVGSSSKSQDLKSAAKSIESSVLRRYEEESVPLSENVAILLCQKMRLAFPVLEETSWFGRTGC